MSNFVHLIIHFLTTLARLKGNGQKERRDCSSQNRSRKGNPKEIWAKQQFASHSIDSYDPNYAEAFSDRSKAYAVLVRSECARLQALWLLCIIYDAHTHRGLTMGRAA